MSKVSRRDREAFAALDRLYAELPAIRCTGQCAISCGSIPLTDLEARRLQLASHQKPRTLPMAATSDPGAEKQRCVYLTPANRCGVYAARPLICRAYALVKLLSCPFGCQPAAWFPDADYLRLAQAVERIGGGRVVRTGPDGLESRPGESYARFGQPTKPPEVSERIAERTRNLRALHGGYIQIAFTDDER